jgi:hypothetical protein
MSIWTKNITKSNKNRNITSSRNPVHHRRTKHIEIDIHFVREKVALGQVRVLHVPTTAQLTNIFTKGLPSSTFFDIPSSLNIVEPHVDTAEGC